MFLISRITQNSLFVLLQILSSQKTPYHQIRDREIDGKSNLKNYPPFYHQLRDREIDGKLISPRSKDYCPKKRGYFSTKKFLCSDRRPPQCFLRQQSFPRGKCQYQRSDLFLPYQPASRSRS